MWQTLVKMEDKGKAAKAAKLAERKARIEKKMLEINRI